MKSIMARLSQLEKENLKLTETLRKKTDSSIAPNANKVVYLKKDGNLPAFKGDGKGMSAAEWNIEATDYLAESDLSDRDKALFLKEKIQGDAYTDLCNALSREDLKNHVRILDSFSEIFCKSTTVEELMKQIWCIKQTKQEPIDEYYRKIMSTHRRIVNIRETAEMGENVLKVIFVKGIWNDSLRLQLETLSINKDVKISKLKEFSVNFETDYKQRAYLNLQAAQVNLRSEETGSTVDRRIDSLEAALKKLTETIGGINLTADRGISDNSRPAIICYRCSEQGHIARNCPGNNRSYTRYSGNDRLYRP